MLAHLGIILAPLGGILGLSWGQLGALLGSARSVVGGSELLAPPKRAQNARDIPRFSHLAAILPHRVAHLGHLKPTCAHLGLS